MKKKNLILCILTVSMIVVLLIIPKLFNSNSNVYIEGRYLLADNGSHLIVTNYNSPNGSFSPIQMFSQDEKIFENVTSGDLIKIATNGVILESYPGQISAFSCIKLKDGERDDVPGDVLQTLIQLNWIKQETAQTAKFITDSINFDVDLPAKWEYKLLSDNQGLRIYPSDVIEGSVDILYYSDGFPLENISDYQAETGSIYFDSYKITRYHYFDLDYDSTHDWLDLRSWDYIHFSEPYQQFVIYNNGADGWTEEQNLTLQNILTTIKFE